MLIVLLLEKERREGVMEWQKEAGEWEGDGCQKSEGPLLPCLDAALAAQ